MALVQRKFVVGDVCFDCWIFKTRDGKFWFKGKDIAQFLGYDNPIQSIRTNVAVDWCKNWSDIEVSYGVAHHNWEPKTVFICEPGLYALLSRSKNPKLFNLLAGFTKRRSRRCGKTERAFATASIRTSSKNSLKCWKKRIKLLRTKFLSPKKKTGNFTNS